MLKLNDRFEKLMNLRTPIMVYFIQIQIRNTNIILNRGHIIIMFVFNVTNLAFKTLFKRKANHSIKHLVFNN